MRKRAEGGAAGFRCCWQWGLLLVFTALLFCVACQHVQPEAISPDTPVPAPMTPARIREEIGQLESLRAKGGRMDTIDGSGLRRLAVLYLHPLNPDPDMARARARFHEYKTGAPADVVFSDEDLALENLLEGYMQVSSEKIRLQRVADRLEKTEMPECRKKNEKLEAACSGLRNENQELRLKIERLKHLDIRLEEKRKNGW